jgi:hypothetical protein
VFFINGGFLRGKKMSMDPKYTTTDGGEHPQKARERMVREEVKEMMRRRAVREQRKADKLFELIGRDYVHGLPIHQEGAEGAKEQDKIAQTWYSESVKFGD